MKIFPKTLIDFKAKGKKFSALTCYDYSFAKIFDQSGIEVLLVGDSLSNVIMGFDSTRKIGMNEMLHHTRAVANGTKNSLVVADMPYKSYPNPKIALKNAKLLLKEGANAVKLEGHIHDVIISLTKKKIPVMGHLGFLPQSMNSPKNIAKSVAEQEKLLFDAIKLERDGCFSTVLECVPENLAKQITEALSIPTIGINSRKYCDGQILVSYDLLGLYSNSPKFAKKYLNLEKEIENAVKKFKKDVLKGNF